MSGAPVTVCVCGQTPPPVHGQSLMIQWLLDGSYSRLRLIHVRMAFSEKVEAVGKAHAAKAALLPGVILRLWAARLKGATVLYYPPAGPDAVPFWRDIALLLPTRWLFPKVIYHFHIAGLAARYDRLPRIGKALFRLAYGRPDLAIYVSGHCPKDAAPMRPWAECVIPNGIPDRPGAQIRERRAQDAPPLILFVGALTPEKGIRTLVQALGLLKGRGVPFRAVLAGPWRSVPFEREIRESLASLSLDAAVRLPGPVDPAPKWALFDEADVFAFPSETDVFGLVLLEAMQSALPVVASDWCGMREIVDEGVTGFRVPRSDPGAGVPGPPLRSRRAGGQAGEPAAGSGAAGADGRRGSRAIFA